MILIASFDYLLVLNDFSKDTRYHRSGKPLPFSYGGKYMKADFLDTYNWIAGAIPITDVFSADKKYVCGD